METRVNLRSSVKDGVEALNYKLGTKEHILWLKKKAVLFNRWKNLLILFDKISPHVFNLNRWLLKKPVFPGNYY